MGRTSTTDGDLSEGCHRKSLATFFFFLEGTVGSAKLWKVDPKTEIEGTDHRSVSDGTLFHQPAKRAHARELGSPGSPGRERERQPRPF